jgi:hypothetical protein
MPQITFVAVQNGCTRRRPFAAASEFRHHPSPALCRSVALAERAPPPNAPNALRDAGLLPLLPPRRSGEEDDMLSSMENWS